MGSTTSTSSTGLWHKWHYSNYGIYGPLLLLQFTTILPHFSEFADVDIVVMHRCSYGEPGFPFFLLGAGDQTKVLFDPLILALGKAIRLWVEGGRDVLFDPELIAESLREV